MSAKNWTIAYVTLWVALIAAPVIAEPPQDFSNFIVVDNATDLATKIAEGETQIYLEAGTYVIDSTITIDHDLYLVGGDTRATFLRSSQSGSPADPLFQVSDPPAAETFTIGMIGLRLEPTDNGLLPAGLTAVRFSNITSFLEFEMQDSTVAQAAMLIEGLGQYRFQNVAFVPNGRVKSPLVVDHPKADVLVIGGNISNNRQPPLIEACGIPGGVCADDDEMSCTSSSATCDCIPADVESCDLHHVWQKRGRLRIYTAGVQGARGTADFRLDSPAVGGPHVIANVRSEGIKCGAEVAEDTRSSGLVLVNGSDEVDVVVMNNEASFHNHSDTCRDWGKGRVVEYNANGTLWAIANNSFLGSGAIVEGAPGSSASIVALGNNYFGNTDDEGADPGAVVSLSNPISNVWESGNTFSRDTFCMACLRCEDGAQDGKQCLDNSDCTGGTCEFACGTTVCDGRTCNDTGLPCYASAQCPSSLCGRRNYDFTSTFEEIDEAIPPVPELTIEPPLTRPTVTAPFGDMIDAMGCIEPRCEIGGGACLTDEDCFEGACGDCGSYYPDYCTAGLRCGSSDVTCTTSQDCPIGESCLERYSDRCGLQAALNTAISEDRPVFLSSDRPFTIDKPLYWNHSQQSVEDADFVSPGRESAGWVVGQGNGATIRFEPNSAYDTLTGAPCVLARTSPDCSMPPETVLASEGIRQATFQGITFEAPAFTGSCSVGGAPCLGDADCSENENCVAGGRCPDGSVCTQSSDCGAGEKCVGSSTVSLESLNADNTFGNSFHDCRFIGGRRGLGIGIDTDTQGDTNLVVKGQFSNSGVGFASGSSNALHNIVYDGQFTGNTVAAGHDPYGLVTQAGTWAMIGANITGSRLKDIEFVQSSRVVYFHDVVTDSRSIVDEPSAAGFPSQFVFDHCEFGAPSSTLFNYRHGVGPTLLYSRLGDGTIRLAASAESVKRAIKLGSNMPEWDSVVRDPISLADEMRCYEWLDLPECTTETTCASQGCSIKASSCADTTLGSTCLGQLDGSVSVETCGAGFVVQECDCKGGPGCNSVTERTVTCDDVDGDGVIDSYDNCRDEPNADQSDIDGDYRGDACDNCRWVENYLQIDSNLDGVGDRCECFSDGDCEDFDPCTDNLCISEVQPLPAVLSGECKFVEISGCMP